MNILIVDDEKDSCFALESFINVLPDCYPVSTTSVTDALVLTKEKKFDLILSDVDMPDLNGIELFTILKSLNRVDYFVLMSGKDDIIKSINSFDIGVYDFLIKPINIYRVKEIIEEIKSHRENKEFFFDIDINKLDDSEIIDVPSLCLDFKKINFGNILAYSDVMKKIMRKIEKIHNYQNIPVLIEGPSGVGKEIIARYIHYAGKENKKPFIGINCANIGKDIFESELFGYSKGAFTGANITGKDGYIKLAENGTLFLDEITEIPYEMQTKLLRVLQENEYYKVGGGEKQKVNCRFVFATNRNIKKWAELKKFREDLYYRISTCKIRIPSLKERKEEIIPLTFYFINELNHNLGKNINKVESGFLRVLLEYEWPGNIRELKNVITNAILFNESNILTRESLNLESGKKEKIKKVNLLDFELPDKPFDLENLIKDIIKKTLIKFKGNKTKTAKFLNISRIQLYKRYKIE
ncbi:MAG TPA: sigma-54 dependent transcriptional regulator [Spirochaetota bacterium]|nr:sigma-54 dependent transcriptional regulator [Spirochaetota bacterium]HOL57804.1 sigma-54 dependent transcriptional regulator [Spirochaetota bacterium]HPP04505.1 sigma-54 dependent transcriptional regulator [Spirochaetota bacterium]